MKSEGNKKVKVILAVLIGLLVIVVAATAFVLVRGKMKESNYTAAVEEAEKYMAESNYEQAVIAYQNAISIDPDKEDAYLGLADAYIAQDHISEARYILRKGFQLTGSARIEQKLNSLENLAQSGKEEGIEGTVDLTAASQNVTWDTSFVQKIVNYTFEDYKDEFGRAVSIETDEEGYLEVRHEKLDAVCYYKNTADNQQIVDVSRKTPYNSSMPEKITLDSLGILFRNFEGGVSLARMQMLIGQKVEPKSLSGVPYIESKEDDLVARFGTDDEGNIVSASCWNELLLPLANKKKASAGTLEGVVIDAVSGNGVAGAGIAFVRRGGSGEMVTGTTDSRGVFKVQLDAGSYEIKIAASGYITEEFIFEMEQGKSYIGEQFVISPELSGEARIVLEWNAQPVDLDSHLTGTTDGGSSIHVYYVAQNASENGASIAGLDLDDTDGYGPETTTIYDLNGVYTFSVFDYLETGTMAENGATVKIYLPGQSPVTVQLQAGSGVENVWKVCRIDHGKLEILNVPGSVSDVR